MSHPAFYAFEGARGPLFHTYGTVLKVECPVCRSRDIENVIRMPLTSIDPPISLFGGYFNQVPTLKSPFEVFGFDLCRACESLFLNPDNEREAMLASYKRSSHYLVKMKSEAEWPGYEERYREMKAYFPENTTTLVDAACGMGQILFVAKRDEAISWTRMVGLELSDAYVGNMRDNGFEAYVFDLDRDDHRTHIVPNSIDFISFFEAFEHVATPLNALSKMMDLLRPGGRIYMSAQRYGADVKLAIRVGEPIYIGEAFVASLPERLKCRLIDVKRTGSRFFIVLEKTEEQTPILTSDIMRVRLGEPIPDWLGAAGRTAIRSDGIVPLYPPFAPELGKCFIAPLGNRAVAAELIAIADSQDHPERSTAILLEDGEPLGPAHSAHSVIRNAGGGAFSHWGKDIYFSTQDGSDPNRNGRTYALKISR